MHLSELIVRFLIGGVIVSFFAVLAEIALATIGITISAHGKTYAAIEARSMIYGAIAFLLYASCVCIVLIRLKPPALAATVFLMPVWFAVSFAFWLIVR